MENKDLFILHMAAYDLIESMKTLSMENVSTGALVENKEHYLSCNEDAKSPDISLIATSNKKKKYRIYYWIVQTDITRLI